MKTRWSPGDVRNYPRILLMDPSRPTRSKHPSFPDPTAVAPLRLSRRILFVLAIALASLVFAVYSPSLSFQFILDDHRFTTDPRIQEAGHVWEYFTNYVWGQITGAPPSFYRPLFVVWMRINFLLSGLSPWGWHFLSILKHLSVALLLGLLAWKLLNDALAAFTAATLFALHPAQTESVSWVTVPDPLMSAGILAALLLYLRYMDGLSPAAQNQSTQQQRAPDKRTRHKQESLRAKSAGQPSPLWLGASALAYFAALLAKETAIVFPCVILALDLHAGRRQIDPKAADANLKPSIARNVPRLLQTLRRILPFACVTALYLLLRLNALSGKLGAATQHLPWTTLLLSWPPILCFYVKAMLWPVKSYSFADPILVETFSVRAFLLPLLALACATVILAAAVLWAWKTSQREPGERDSIGIESVLIIGTILLLLPLLLALNLNALNPGDFLHGRYTYLPLAGLMLLVATGLHLLGKLGKSGKMRIVSLGSVCVLVVASALFTFAQQNQWKDDSTVFTVAHQLAPHNAPVAQNLADTRLQSALQLDEQGRCPEALPVFEQVTQEYPQNWYAWAGLGDCYVQLNNLPKAEESLHRAADLSQNPRVIQQWQELRAQMGLSTSVP